MTTTLQILAGIALTLSLLFTFYAGYRAGMTDGEQSARAEAEEQAQASQAYAQHNAEDAQAHTERAEHYLRLVNETDRDTLNRAASALHLAARTFNGLGADDKASDAHRLARQLEQIATRPVGQHPDAMRINFLETTHTGRDFDDVALYLPVGPDYTGGATLRAVIDHAMGLQAKEVRNAA